MKYLDRVWSLNFIFYFTGLKSQSKVMIITDHPQRLGIDFSLFDIIITFYLPDKFKRKVETNSEHDVRFFNSDNEITNVAQYSLIIIDLKRSSYHLNLLHFFARIHDSAFVAILDWSNGRFLSVKNTLWHFGIFSKYVFELLWHGTIIPTKKHVILKSYFLIDPSLHKPATLTMRTFGTELPINSNSPFKNFLSRIGGFYLLPHNKIYVFGKPIKSEDIIEKLLIEISKKFRVSNGNFKIKKISISRTGFLLIEVLMNTENLMVRFPLGKIAHFRLKKQHEILEFLNEKGYLIGPKPVNIPADISFPYFIETKLGTGVSPYKLIRRSNGLQRLYKAILSKTEEMHLMFGRQVIMSDEIYDKHLMPKFELIKNFNPVNPLLSQIDNFINNLYAILKEKKFLIGITHGDLKIGNSIFDSTGKLVGLIDWDMSEWEELTLIDLSALFATAIRMRDYGKLPIKEFMLSISRIPEEFLSEYENYFAKTKTSYINPFISILIYWLDRISKMIQYHTKIDEQWMKKMVYPVLNRTDQFFDAAKNERNYII